VTTYTFDANGNQRSEVIGAGARVTYTWDPRNLLTNYGAADGQIATYTHRYDDLRATLDPGNGEATRLVWDPLGTSGYVDVLGEAVGIGGVPKCRPYAGVRAPRMNEV